MAKKKLTLQEIGDLAGVSAMTVSRVLRGSGHVKAATRERILKIAGESRPLNAQSLGTSSASMADTHDLRILMIRAPHDESPRQVSILDFGKVVSDSLAKSLSSQGGHLYHAYPDDLDELLKVAKDNRIHGIVLRTLIPNHWLEAISQRFGVVYATSHDFQSGVDAVYSNEHRSAAQIYERVRQLGHSEIAWCGIIDSHQPKNLSYFESLDSVNATERIASSIHGVRHAAWANLAYCQPREARQGLILLERDWRKASIGEMIQLMAEKILDLQSRPSVVVVDSDSIAFDLKGALERLGLRVPKDISIVGYGGSLMKSGLIASVELPFVDIARSIPDLIRRRLRNPQAPAISMQFEATLLDGSTLGPCKKPKK